MQFFMSITFGLKYESAAGEEKEEGKPVSLDAPFNECTNHREPAS